nr:undecaprenyl-phosphate galactose phosphotransferase WbaP [Marinithermus hydrothermalis]
MTVVTRPWLTASLLLVSDLVALAVAGALSVGLRYLFDGGFNPAVYGPLWPVVGLFVLVYALVGLYPGVGVAPAEELRRLTLATTLVYLVLGAALFLFKEGGAYSRAVFLVAWVFSVVLVPLGRALVRHLCAHRRWWGYPAVVLGAGKTGRMVVRMLVRQPGLGLKPVAVLDDDPEKHGALEGVPVVGGVDLAPVLARELGVRYAIVAMPGVPRARLLEVLERYGSVFPHLVLIPDLFGFSSLWVSAKDLGGVLGLEVRQRLLLPGPRLVKRFLDLAATVVGGVLVLPLMLLIALFIKLDSPGPVFYLQDRLGKDGRRFKAIKFRTMYGDGEKRLAELLAQNPELRAEYELYHKLRNDPRVTRFGRVLRKLSLDELPQLWNVLKGEMSLVGPRAYLPRELPKMSGAEGAILKVMPGITGIWQVSGRNEVTFRERLNMDMYYVRNWSVWLDLYILARTVWVVLFGKGAY